MHRARKLKLSEFNSNLKCPLCKGYLIDSYTINECLHSFCKSCIIRYVKKKECCPICKIAIMKEKISSFLRRDVNLQCVVYKLVPGLFQKEMQRRRDFYTAHPKAIKFLKKRKICDKEALGELDVDELMAGDVYSEFSLSLEYSETGLAEICNSQRQRVLDPTIPPRTYLQCTSGLTVQLLKRFLAMKYEAEEVPTDMFEIMYDDKPLADDLTLLDIAYIYAWRHTAPMRLFYRVKDYKRPVPSPLPLDQAPPTIEEIRAEENDIEKPPVATTTSDKPVLGQIDNKMNEFVAQKQQEADKSMHVVTSDENAENHYQPLVSTKPIDQSSILNTSTDQTKSIANKQANLESTFETSIKENINNNNAHDTQQQSNVSLNMSTSTVADYSSTNAPALTITSMMASMKQQQQLQPVPVRHEIVANNEPVKPNMPTQNTTCNTLPKTKKPPKEKSESTTRQIKPKKQKTGAIVTSSPIVNSSASNADLRLSQLPHVPPQTSTPIESMLPAPSAVLKSIKSEPIQPPATPNYQNRQSGNNHVNKNSHSVQQQSSQQSAMPPPSILPGQFNPLMPALMNQFWKAATSGATANPLEFASSHHHHPHQNPLYHQMQMQQMQQAAYISQQQKLFASMFAQGGGQSASANQQHSNQQFGSFYNNHMSGNGYEHHSNQNSHPMQANGFQFGFPPHPHQMMLHSMYNAAAAAANNNNNHMNEDVKPAHLASSFQDAATALYKSLKAVAAVNNMQTGVSFPMGSSAANSSNHNNNISGNTSNCSDSLDSLKETGLKISESCNLVNE